MTVIFKQRQKGGGVELEASVSYSNFPVSIAALFTIVKSWKQPNCPLMNECKNKM